MLRKENTDHEWEKFGQQDPYFGVLASDRFHKEKMRDEDYEAFFSSGEKTINQVLETIRNHFNKDFVPEQSIDFGCGVGRLTIPLARVSGHVTALDISDAMLSEGRKNSAAQGLTNISFVKSDDTLTALDKEYNCLVSEIVFQHIPKRRGMQILGCLINRLSKGGAGYLQLTTQRSFTSLKEIYYRLRTVLPGAGILVNAVKRKPLHAPFMQMNVYELNSVMAILQENGVEKVYCQLYQSGEYRGVHLYFQK